MKFTPSQISWLKENYPVKGAKYCAEYLKVTKGKVGSFCHKHGIKGDKDSEANKARYKDLHKATKGSRLKHNNFEELEDERGPYIKVELTQGKYTLCDREDWFEKLDKYQWHAEEDSNAKGTYYARSTESVLIDGKRKQSRIHMNRLVLNLGPVSSSNLKVDHIDHDTLLNRRYNLRACTSTQNSQNCKLQKKNKSGYHGVSAYIKNGKWTGKWVAKIKVNNSPIHLKYHDTKEGAAEARDLACIRLGVDFAVLNFPHRLEEYKIMISQETITGGIPKKEVKEDSYLIKQRKEKKVQREAELLLEKNKLLEKRKKLLDERSVLKYNKNLQKLQKEADRLLEKNKLLEKRKKLLDEKEIRNEQRNLRRLQREEWFLLRKSNRLEKKKRLLDEKNTKKANKDLKKLKKEEELLLKKNNRLERRKKKLDEKGALKTYKEQQKLKDREESLELSPTVRYRGVHWVKKTGRWIASVQVGDKQVYISCFSSKLKAAKAHDYSDVWFNGDKAILNFPELLDFYKDQISKSTDGGKTNPYSPKRVKSGFKGVTKASVGNKWVSKYKSKYLARFDYTEEGKIKAAKSYDLQALKCEGEKAKLNLPEFLEEYKQKLQQLDKNEGGVL